jgi:RNA polymerase sigma-70 factor (ECF subfamily)
VVLQQYEHAAVRNAVDRLKADDREMLLLSAWEGLTHAEIAEAMGLTLATVDKRLSRAKERLRRQFEAVRSSHRPPMNTARGGDAS